MEPIRLRKIRDPSRVEKLLDAPITSTRLVPEGAHQLRDRGGLPSALRSILVQVAGKERAWTCWTDSSRIWLFTAEMSLALSRSRGAPALKLNVYNESAALDDAGDWMVDLRKASSATTIFALRGPCGDSIWDSLSGFGTSLMSKYTPFGAAGLRLGRPHHQRGAVAAPAHHGFKETIDRLSVR